MVVRATDVLSREKFKVRTPNARWRVWCDVRGVAGVYEKEAGRVSPFLATMVQRVTHFSVR